MWHKTFYGNTLHWFTSDNRLNESPTACGKMLFINNDPLTPASRRCKKCEKVIKLLDTRNDE
jgi:hypothetical protein